MKQTNKRREACEGGQPKPSKNNPINKNVFLVKEMTPMKRLVALAVLAIASQAIVFAGEPVVSSKQVIAPPPPPPVSFFRGNEFDIGAFVTYVTGTNGGGTRQTVFDDGTTFTLSSSRSPDGWGGGLDFTYWFPWKYAGVRFQGAGVSLTSG